MVWGNIKKCDKNASLYCNCAQAKEKEFSSCKKCLFADLNVAMKEEKNIKQRKTRIEGRVDYKNKNEEEYKKKNLKVWGDDWDVKAFKRRQKDCKKTFEIIWWKIFKWL